MKLIRITRTCYYAGPPTLGSSRQPKQYGYQLKIGRRVRRLKPPFYFEWRTRVVMPWEKNYATMEIN